MPARVVAQEAEGRRCSSRLNGSNNDFREAAVGRRRDLAQSAQAPGRMMAEIS